MDQNLSGLLILGALLIVGVVVAVPYVIKWQNRSDKDQSKMNRMMR